jgi:ribulose-phosphate 3-epimerase
VLKSLRNATKLPFDVHLMVSNPSMFIRDYIKAGANLLTLHIEANTTADDLRLIRELGATPALSVNPETPVGMIYDYINLIDMVLIMSVNPGFGGQAFIADVLDKVKKIRKINSNIDISIDGGITHDNVKQALDTGVNIIVAGTSVFNGDITNNVKRFYEIMK